MLLRGLARESGHWGDEFPAALAAAMPGAQIETPDIPGCGTRVREQAPTSVAELVAAVRSERAAPDPPGELWLLGLSLGGMMACAWMRAFPAEVSGIVVINSSAADLSPPWRRLLPGAVDKLLRAGFGRDPADRERAVLKMTSGDPERTEHMLPAWLEISRRRPVSSANSTRQMLAALQFKAGPGVSPVPSLVLSSGADRMVDPSCSAALAMRLGATLSVHPTAGHDLPLDDPAWVVDQVAAWEGRLRNRHRTVTL